MFIHDTEAMPLMLPWPDDELSGTGRLTPTARAILQHLCSGDAACRAVAHVSDWCDAADDRDHLVICPGCGHAFPVTECDLADLRAWTNGLGQPFTCGVQWD
jgi:hypothetical protein